MDILILAKSSNQINLPPTIVLQQLQPQTMVLLSDKIMAREGVPSSNPLRDALTSAPTALAMFVSLLAVSSFLDAHLCASSGEQEHEDDLGGECSLFCSHVSFFAYALLVAYVTVLIDAAFYCRRHQQSNT